jgi:hypothetical protein
MKPSWIAVGLAGIFALPATSQQPASTYNIELVIFRAATALGGA